LHSILVILAEATIAAQPGKSALRNPGEPGNLKSSLLSFEDLQLPTLVALDLLGELAAGVTGIGDQRVLEKSAGRPE
jgi:hypothetical protein